MGSDVSTTVALIGLAVAAFGALFAAIGIGVRRGQSRFKARAARATGTVTGLRARSVGRDTGGGMVWVPVVRFATADGRTVEAEAGGGSNVKRHREGQPIEVLYDPANPADVRIPDWGSSLIHTMFIGIGGVFVLIGLAILAVAVAVA